MQTFFQNPLAGPYVLGIQSGASLGVAFWTLLFIPLSEIISAKGMVATSQHLASLAGVEILKKGGNAIDAAIAANAVGAAKPSVAETQPDINPTMGL